MTYLLVSYELIRYLCGSSEDLSEDGTPPKGILSYIKYI